MSSIAKTQKRSKKTKCLGTVQVLRPDQYEAFDVDSKLEIIRALIPLELMHVQEAPEEEHGLLKAFTERIVERALQAELTTHLGYAPHAVEGRGSGNSRNGTTSKTVQTAQGTVPLDIPRDRQGSFEPQLVKKRQRRLEGFDDKVLAL